MTWVPWQARRQIGRCDPMTTSGGKPSPKSYFPGLDSLRFYAAISVVVAQTTNNFGEFRSRRADYVLLNLVLMDSQSAVSLFFVLSGFLITYLLLKEIGR